MLDSVKAVIDLARPIVPYVTGGISAIVKPFTFKFYSFENDVKRKVGVKRSKSNLNILEDDEQDILPEPTQEDDLLLKKGFFRTAASRIAQIPGDIKNYVKENGIVKSAALALPYALGYTLYGAAYTLGYGFYNTAKAIGKTISFSIDILFGPSTMRVITLACAVGMLFSPVGPIVGGIALGVSALCVGYGMVQDARHQRQLRKVQKEERLLNDITILETKNLEHLKGIAQESPDAAKMLNSILTKNREERSEKMDQQPDIKLKVKSILDCTPENMVPLIGNILTLNPVLIILGSISTVGAAAVAHKEAKAFSEQSNELLNCISKRKEFLGLSYGTGKGLDDLNKELKNRFKETKAIEELSKNPQSLKGLTEDQLKAKLEVEMAKVQEKMNKAETQLKTLKAEGKGIEDLDKEDRQYIVKTAKVKHATHYAWKNFKAGFSWDKDYTARTPLSRHHKMDHTKLDDKFQRAKESYDIELTMHSRTQPITISKQKTRERGSANEIVVGAPPKESSILETSEKAFTTTNNATKGDKVRNWIDKVTETQSRTSRAK